MGAHTFGKAKRTNQESRTVEFPQVELRVPRLERSGMRSLEMRSLPRCRASHQVDEDVQLALWGQSPSVNIGAGAQLQDTEKPYGEHSPSRKRARGAHGAPDARFLAPVVEPSQGVAARRGWARLAQQSTLTEVSCRR